MSNDFASLLSVFRDATSSSGSVKPNASAPANNSGGGGEQPGRASSGSCRREEPLHSSTGKSSNSPTDPTSTKDPSFSAPILKERIERILRVQQIRRSTASSNTKDDEGRSDDAETKRAVHIAICATIVDEFPHEGLWRKWMEETGGEFALEDVISTTTANDASIYNDGDDEGKTKSTSKFTASAELYVHAKNRERVRSEWLRSKALPISHRPNWNDVRIVRAMLSLLEAALREERTTHVLFCTESCIPVATLKEIARSVLLDEVCNWVEMGNGRENLSKQQKHNRQRLDWDRSYVDCYGRNSSRCTRFDEHNCWDILRDSIPGEAIHKALPGWCLLSRKHAQSILNIPSQLGGLNLWPAFERVWAPEEVYFPTALAICGHMDEVSKRSLTHSQWDERASNHKDRAHPLSYDGCFDDKLVSRVRRDGCLFLRKMKRLLDLSVWEQIVVQHKRAQDTGSRHSERGRDWDMDSGRDQARGGDRYQDHGERNRSNHWRSNADSGRRHSNDNQWRQKRGRDDDRSSSYDSSRRQRWRR